MKLGEIIKGEKTSIAEISELTGIPQRTLQGYQHGRNMPDTKRKLIMMMIERKKRIAKATGKMALDGLIAIREKYPEIGLDSFIILASIYCRKPLAKKITLETIREELPVPKEDSKALSALFDCHALVNLGNGKVFIPDDVSAMLKPVLGAKKRT